MAARPLRVQVQSLEVRRPDDLENAFRAAGKGRTDPSHRTIVKRIASPIAVPAATPTSAQRAKYDHWLIFLILSLSFHEATGTGILVHHPV